VKALGNGYATPMRGTGRARSLRPIGACLLASLLALTAIVGSSAGADGRSRNALPDCQREGDDHRPRWHPGPTTEPWQWQLQGKIDMKVAACIYDVDGFETSRRTVAALHRRHVKVICYLDVGSWESYRPDKSEFPRSVIGRRYQGFPDERWLDVSRFHLFEGPLKRRFDICARKGFDAVEPDNIAGWERENHTGFRITRRDQLRFNRWLAREVHGRGMSIALKNDGRQAKQLVHAYDFAIVEQCFQYDECGLYRPFVVDGKAVLETEYEEKPSRYCKTALALRFSSIRKSYDLFARPWQPCA
jgi:hypothetical protein